MEKKAILYLLMVVLLSLNKAHAQNKTNTTNNTGSPEIGSSLSIRQAVDIAIKNNLLVNQADLLSQTGRTNLNQAWDNLLPYVAAQATQGIGFGRSLITQSYTYTDEQTVSGNYSANANLTLFSGLSLQNSIRQYNYAYKATKMDLQQQKDNITLSVLLAYLQVLSSQDLLNISRELAGIDDKQVQRLQGQNKEGALLLLSNLTDLRGQYAGDQANLAIAAGNLESAKINLFQLLNIPYKRELEYDRSALLLQLNDYQENPDSIYQTALHTLPSIKSADLRILSYQKALAAARGLYYPTLSFYANVNSYYSNAAPPTQIPTGKTDLITGNIVTVGGTQYDVIAPQQQQYSNQNPSWGDQFKNNRQTSLGLQLNIPILNFLRARNNVKMAKINLRNTEINANSTRLLLQQSVEQAYQNMISSYKQYKSYIDQAAAYNESFRTTEIRFNEGVINSDVYVIAKNNSDRANISLAQAKYTYIFRTKVLDYYQGRLSLQMP
ncbi:TolC family protein [Flavitalea flava]